MFTEGEWIVSDWGHNKVVEIPETDKEICVISKHYEDYEANARLIAQAPRMYEALKRISAFYSDTNYKFVNDAMIEAVREINRAIAGVEK